MDDQPPGDTLQGWQMFADEILRENEHLREDNPADPTQKAHEDSPDEDFGASDCEPDHADGPDQELFASPQRLREHDRLRAQAHANAASLMAPSRVSIGRRERPCVVMKAKSELTLEYSIGELIGRGAFGEAHKGKRLSDGEDVVIKNTNVVSMTAQERDATRNEVDVLASLDHPNIVKYYDCFADATSMSIVMEYCGNGDLTCYLKQRDGQLLTEDEIMIKFVQMCLALQSIHRERIVHRDLKCSNIFLSDSGIVKLGDFGISKAKNTLSDLHSMVGTPRYMAPEVLKSKPYDTKSDIFSLGCVLYEMASLRPAFEGDNFPAIIIRVINGKYSPLPDTYSAGLNKLVRRLLARKPQNRPSIDELLRSSFVKHHIDRYEHHIDRYVVKRQDSFRRSVNCLGLLVDDYNGEDANGHDAANGGPGPVLDSWGSSSSSERLLRAQSATVASGRAPPDASELLGNSRSPSFFNGRGGSTGGSLATPHRKQRSTGGAVLGPRMLHQRPSSETSPTSPFAQTSRHSARGRTHTAESGMSAFSAFAELYIESPSVSNSNENNLVYHGSSMVHSPNESSEAVGRRAAQQQNSQRAISRAYSQPMVAASQQYQLDSRPSVGYAGHQERMGSSHGQLGHTHNPITPRSRTRSTGITGTSGGRRYASQSQPLSPEEIRLMSPDGLRGRQSSTPGVQAHPAKRERGDRWPSSPGIALRAPSHSTTYEAISSRPHTPEAAYHTSTYSRDVSADTAERQQGGQPLQRRGRTSRSQSQGLDMLGGPGRHPPLVQQDLIAQELAHHESPNVDAAGFGPSRGGGAWPPRTISAGTEYGAGVQGEDPLQYFDQLRSGPSMHSEQMMTLTGQRSEVSALHGMALTGICSSGGASSHSGASRASSAASTRYVLNVAEQEVAILKLRKLRESLQIPVKAPKAELVQEADLEGEAAVRWSSMSGSMNGMFPNARLSSSPGMYAPVEEARARRASRMAYGAASTFFTGMDITTGYGMDVHDGAVQHGGPRGQQDSDEAQSESDLALQEAVNGSSDDSEAGSEDDEPVFMRRMAAGPMAPSVGMIAAI